MGWYRKEYETRFDNTPIEGVFFVDGNIFERITPREYSSGMKKARIIFPSDEEFELWDEQRFLVNVIDVLDLPYFDTCQAAFECAQGFITTGLSAITQIEKLDEAQLLLYSEPNRAGCIITYDNASVRMTNVKLFALNGVGEQ